MAFTWTIAPDSSLGRITVSVTGLVATGHTYTLQRQSPSGTIDNVRNAEPVTAGVTGLVINDWEAPPDTPVRYLLLDVVNATGASSQNFAPGGPWVWSLPFPYNCRILHPTVPALSVKSIINVLSEQTRDVRTETHYPLGRADPVVVAQVRQLPTGTVALLTLTPADGSALVTLLTQASVFNLQTPAAHRLGFDGTLWFAAGSLVERRSGSAEALTGPRVFEMAWSQVQRPPGTVSSATGSWAEIPPKFATWTALVSANASWNAVVFGAEVDPNLRLVRP